MAAMPKYLLSAGNIHWGNILKRALAIMLMAGLAAPAVAADFVVLDPVIEYEDTYAHDWSGFYAGVLVGYGSGQGQIAGGGVTPTYPVSGGLVGGTLGYNVQYDSFVLGVEGDLSASGIRGSSPCALDPTMTCTGELTWLGTLRGRAGYAMDSALLYATGGLAVGGVNITETPAPLPATGLYSNTFVGWTLGAGVELAVNDSLSVKAEYNYINLGTRTAPVGTLANGSSFDISPTVHTVKIGANFHF